MKMQTEKGKKAYEPRFSNGKTIQALLTAIGNNIIKINNNSIKNNINN